MLLKSCGLLLLCLGLAACSQLENPGNVTAADKAVRAQTADGDHMVSFNAADAPRAATAASQGRAGLADGGAGQRQGLAELRHRVRR